MSNCHRASTFEQASLELRHIAQLSYYLSDWAMGTLYKGTHNTGFSTTCAIVVDVNRDVEALPLRHIVELYPTS